MIFRPTTEDIQSKNANSNVAFFDIDKSKEILTNNLQRHLAMSLPRHSIKDVYHWAVLPPGKLFRPLLMLAIFQDQGDSIDDLLNYKSPLSFLGSAIELHHAYTLVHDDLPCMDNDSVRRNKPSTHVQFGQWKSLLIGDGLLNCSYYLLSKINTSNFREVEIFRFFSWALGTKGLIQGQILDLSNEANRSFKALLETHCLKTSRLIQVAIICALLLSKVIPQNSYRLKMDLYKLGHHLGLLFQLLDDYDDFNNKTLGLHEREINPFFDFERESLEQITKSFEKINYYIKRHNLLSMEFLFNDYYLKKVDFPVIS